MWIGPWVGPWRGAGAALGARRGVNGGVVVGWVGSVGFGYKKAPVPWGDTGAGVGLQGVRLSVLLWCHVRDTIGNLEGSRMPTSHNSHKKAAQEASGTPSEPEDEGREGTSERQLNRHEKRIIELDSRRSKQADDYDRSYFTVSSVALGFHMALLNTSGGAVYNSLVLMAVVFFDVLAFLVVILSYIRIAKLHIEYYITSGRLEMCSYNKEAMADGSKYPDPGNLPDLELRLDYICTKLKRYDRLIRKSFRAGICLFVLAILLRLAISLVTP